MGTSGLTGTELLFFIVELLDNRGRLDCPVQTGAITISCKSSSSSRGAGGADGDEVSVDAYGKTDDEDDFKIAGQPTAVTGGGLALAGISLEIPMRLDGSYSCTMTLQKVDRNAFTLNDVGAAASCAVLPGSASGLYFRMTRLESDALYVATVQAIDPVSNAEKTYKIAIPPLSSTCRAGVTQFTMIADTLTTRVANVVLELVSQASSAGGADSNAQKTLRNLILPDLEHFAAASRQEFSVAARTYSETFSRIYDTRYASEGDQFGTAVCQALIGTLIKTGSIIDNTNLPSQSSAVQSWLAISKIADAFNEEVTDVYTVTNVTGSFDGFFGYLAAVIKAADNSDQVSSVIEEASENQDATVETISELAEGNNSGGGGGDGGGGGGSSQASGTWSAIAISDSPAPRWLNSTVWTGSTMIIWGGAGGSSAGSCPTPDDEESCHAQCLSDPTIAWCAGQSSSPMAMFTGGIYSPVSNSWAPTNTMGAPTGRYSHSAVWAPEISKMIVWGGEPTTLNFLNSGGIYDPITELWAVTQTSGAPDARKNHSAVWTGSQMVVWGGSSNMGYHTTGGIYDPAANGGTGSWTATQNPPDVPLGRQGHTAIWTGSKMIIWGGSGNLGVFNTGGVFDPPSNVWEGYTQTSGAPDARTSHTVVWTGSKMIVWGGLGISDTILNSGGIFDPVAQSWTATSTASAPAARRDHTAVWTGTKMIVWGGHDANPGFTNSGGIYDLANNSWTATPTSTAPLARWLHSGIWTGTKMIIWGGTETNDSGLFLANGSTFVP